MEIEAKFSFRGEAAFAAWQQRDSIGAFALGSTTSKVIVDRYLDTDLCDCLAGGYACRIRRHGSAFEVTLKSLNDAAASEAGVRRREEIELTLEPPSGAAVEAEAAEPLPRWQQPENWPESEARTLALHLTRGRRLRHLVTVRQHRAERELLDGERDVAVQSLDRVSFDGGGPTLLELEVELRPQGSDADMSAIVRALSSEGGFQADRRSKLGGALAGIAPPTKRSLRAQDALFTAHLPDERDRYRARLALRLLESVSDPEDRQARGLARSAIMALSEGRTVRSDDPAGAAFDLLAGRAGDANPNAGPLAVVLQQLSLPRDHSSGGSTGPAAAARARSTMGIGQTEGMAGRPGSAWFDRSSFDSARRVAAVIAVGLALDDSARQTTQIVAVTSTERRTLVTLFGPDAAGDGAAAEELNDLWQDTFGVELRCRTRNADEQPPLGLRFDHDLAEAGRIILRNQYERLQACEAEVRAGDVEAIHDGRVAGRRLRTALTLLKRAYIGRESAPLLNGLKRTGDRLGAVRDLDVLLARVRHEREQLPDPSVLDGLLGDWEQRRGQAQVRLLKHLDSADYRDWNARFTVFLEAGGSGRTGEQRVADLLPELVWKRYGRVRSYQAQLDTAPPEELHDLRKDAKELRYLLEFFRELLGKQAPTLIKQVTGVQDALGTLHDAVVLRDLVGKALAGPKAAPGLEQYQLHVLAAIPRHRRDFEALWPALVGRDFRKALAEATATV